MNNTIDLRAAELIKKLLDDFELSEYTDRESKINPYLNAEIIHEIALSKLKRDKFLKSYINKKKDGFVYLIKNPSTNNYKIGSSLNLKNRLKTFKNASGLEMDIILKKRFIGFEVELHKKIEKHLHKIYSHKKITGEWFKLNDNDIIDIKNMLNG